VRLTQRPRPPEPVSRRLQPSLLVESRILAQSEARGRQLQLLVTRLAGSSGNGARSCSPATPLMYSSRIAGVDVQRADCCCRIQVRVRVLLLAYSGLTTTPRHPARPRGNPDGRYPALPAASDPNQLPCSLSRRGQVERSAERL
jgi:hypothetical protein